jgi:hypothetical protein
LPRNWLSAHVVSCVVRAIRARDLQDDCPRTDTRGKSLSAWLGSAGT